MFGEREACPALVNGSIPARRPGGSVAEGRYLADEETIHYGIIPRTNRGVFACNELPDLTEKVQVGLFNLMEEKDCPDQRLQDPAAARRDHRRER